MAAPKKISFFKNEESMNETTTPQRPLLSPEKREAYLKALNELVGSISLNEPTYLDVTDFCTRHGLKESFIDALRDLDGLCWEFKQSTSTEHFFTKTTKLMSIVPEDVLVQMRKNGHKTARKIGAVTSDDIDTISERDIVRPPIELPTPLDEPTSGLTESPAQPVESVETKSSSVEGIIANPPFSSALPQPEKREQSKPRAVIKPDPQPVKTAEPSFAFPYSLKVTSTEISLYMDVKNSSRANLALQLLMLINDATE